MPLSKGQSLGAAAAIVIVGAALPAAAQSPPLNLIVGFAAGGSADSVARVVGSRLGEKLGQKVVIENRPGAGANVAARAVTTSPADGNTLLVTTAALPINNTLYKNKGFDIADLRPVSIAGTTPETFAVNKDNPSKTLKEFISAAQGKKINFGTAGVGTGSHIFAAFFFKTIAKVEASHVAFRGGPDATNNLLGGHVDMVAASLSGFAAQINSGAINGIAIATDKRFAAVPNVPTFAEAGYPGLTSVSWAGFFAPGKTPDAVVAKQNAALLEIIKEKDINERLQKIGFTPMLANLKDTEAFFKRELEDWGKMVRTLGLSVD
jgi:tripartite-type tricarboxylate transporter receptor subunit TctC